MLTGGTDVHLVLVDLRELRSPELSGRQAEDRLHEIGITVNRNAVPFDPRPADGGLRPAHRHARAGHARPAGRGLRRGRRRSSRRRCSPETSPPTRPSLAERVQAIVERYPLYESLAVRATV